MCINWSSLSVEGGMECALIGVHCLLRVGWSVH